MVKEVADRQGFEPWNTVRCYLLSKQAPSTARPPVRGADDINSSLLRLRGVRALGVRERRRNVETGLVFAANALRRVERRDFQRIARIRRFQFRRRLERRQSPWRPRSPCCPACRSCARLLQPESKRECEDAGEENDGYAHEGCDLSGSQEFAAAGTEMPAANRDSTTTAWYSADSSVNGRRSVPPMSPMRATAHFTGIGLDSTNRLRCRATRR